MTATKSQIKIINDKVIIFLIAAITFSIGMATSWAEMKEIGDTAFNFHSLANMGFNVAIISFLGSSSYEKFTIIYPGHISKIIAICSSLAGTIITLVLSGLFSTVEIGATLIISSNIIMSIFAFAVSILRYGHAPEFEKTYKQIALILANGLMLVATIGESMVQMISGRIILGYEIAYMLLFWLALGCYAFFIPGIGFGRFYETQINSLKKMSMTMSSVYV
ncbi:MAG: hypothetical protein KAS12_01825 [Candidatus Aenigmarchaeota archaeon]|nr:hypothetical protein [Candidatus Aenigmarchaeota archaeon]